MGYCNITHDYAHLRLLKQLKSSWLWRNSVKVYTIISDQQYDAWSVVNSTQWCTTRISCYSFNDWIACIPQYGQESIAQLRIRRANPSERCRL